MEAKYFLTFSLEGSARPDGITVSLLSLQNSPKLAAAAAAAKQNVFCKPFLSHRLWNTLKQTAYKNLIIHEIAPNKSETYIL